MYVLPEHVSEFLFHLMHVEKRVSEASSRVTTIRTLSSRLLIGEPLELLEFGPLRHGRVRRFEVL